MFNDFIDNETFYDKEYFNEKFFNTLYYLSLLLGIKISEGD